MKNTYLTSPKKYYHRMPYRQKILNPAVYYRRQIGQHLTKALFTVCLLTCATTLFSQTTWIGTTSSEWNMASNWNSGNVPDSNTDVIIAPAPNHPIISATTSTGVKSIIIQANANLTNNGDISIIGSNTTGLLVFGTSTNNGTILIDDTNIFGIWIAGTGLMTNNGLLEIGNNGEDIGGNGLYSEGEFVNQSLGVVVIENTESIGIANNGGSLHNHGTIQIGKNGGAHSIKQQGIWNYASGLFVNEVNATLTIDNAQTGITNTNNSNLTNLGTLEIGKNGGANSIGQSGIINFNSSTFSNEVNAIITIDNTKLSGIDNRNSSSTFTNFGNIEIGKNGGANSIGQSGILNFNSSTFSNEVNAILTIDNTKLSGIDNSKGLFTNKGTTHIGKEVGAIGRSGIVQWVDGDFSNEANALITIDNTSENGILNRNNSNLTNLGTLEIGKNGGANSIGKNGIDNLASSTFSNGVSSILSIDNTKVHGIYSRGLLFVNHGIIELGQLGSLGNKGLRNTMTFRNEAGTIKIDNTIKNALGNDDGTFVNKSNILIGQLSDIPFSGIENYGSFINESGEIIIDNSLRGILTGQNSDFINEANISIGQNGGIEDNGIENSGNIVNNAGTIKIDNTGNNGVENRLGIITNLGLINIGKEDGNIGGEGIEQLVASTFTNEANAVVTIDNTSEDGITNSSSTFTNFGNIEIGKNGIANSIGQIGIYNFNSSTFSNEVNAIITIDNTKFSGINNTKGLFTNKGTTNIGKEVGAIGGSGIVQWEDGDFSNEANALITIDNTLQNGIYSESSIFSNLGNIEIGKNGGANSIGQSGIDNLASSTFSNGVSSILSIDNTKVHGIYSRGLLFVNHGIIELGQLGSLGNKGLRNTMTFRNEAGTIKIDNTIKNALGNDNGTFVNKSNILIGQLSDIPFSGIENFGSFINESGEIIIDNSLGGILTGGNSDFINEANLSIGQNGGIEDNGIENSGNIVNNAGTIEIDNTAKIGLLNFSTISNFSNILIGQNGLANSVRVGFQNQGTTLNGSGSIMVDNTDVAGVYNFGDLINHSNILVGQTDNSGADGVVNDKFLPLNLLGNFNNTGSIIVDNSNIGLFNAKGQFTNSGSITIDEKGQTTRVGLRNIETLINEPCGHILVYSDLKNSIQADFTNQGYLTIDTNKPHINKGNFTNDGLISYTQEPNIPDVVNNEIIVDPDTTTSCSISLSPAFDVSNAATLVIDGIYSDPEATISAGAYDPVTNTFSPTVQLSGITNHSLYVKVTDTAHACDSYIAEWRIETEQAPITGLIDGDWDYAAKVLAGDIEGSDNYGQSVSISGIYAIVGAPQEDTGAADAGAAYIFKRSGLDWLQHSKIQASDKETGDLFGWAVAINGNYAIVGAKGEDSGGNNAGAAYIFQKDSTSWTESAKLLSSDAEAGDFFGAAVDIDSKKAIVGAHGEATGGSNAGAAYLYSLTGSTWEETAKIQAEDKEEGDEFGGSVSLSGDYTIVGARLEDSGGIDAGAAYIFASNGSNWVQEIKLQASDIEPYDAFGHSVSIDGTDAIIGAYTEDAGGTNNAGAAYIFKMDSTSWVEEAKIQAADKEPNDGFGYAVAIYGDQVMVGAHSEDPGGVTNAGSVYVFRRTGTNWTQETKLEAPDQQPLDLFGYSVGLSDQFAVVGAVLEDEGGAEAGASYYFDKSLSDLLDECSITPQTPSVENNCTVVQYGSTAITFPITTQGITTIEWDFIDLDGHTVTLKQEVIINDVTGPSINCPASVTSQLVDPGECHHTGTYDALGMDNCLSPELTYSIDGIEITYPYAFPIGNHTVDALVTDGGGHTAECSFSVEIVGYVGPSDAPLLALYESTNGDAWTNTIADDNVWFTDCDPCGFLDGTAWHGITCDGIGHITEIDLSNNNLSGTLSDNIYQLSELTHLDLHDNAITGGIPYQLGFTPMLTNLILSSNQLDGSIPMELGNLALEELKLYDNDLTGCYDSNLLNLCGSLLASNSKNTYISNGNDLNAPWEEFCTCGAGLCLCGNINTWIGGMGSWDDSANWSLGHVPLACEQVEIMSAGDYVQLPADYNAVIYLLTVDGDAELDIPDSAKLTVLSNNWYDTFDNCGN